MCADVQNPYDINKICLPCMASSFVSTWDHVYANCQNNEDRNDRNNLPELLKRYPILELVTLVLESEKGHVSMCSQYLDTMVDAMSCWRRLGFSAQCICQVVILE